MAAFLSLLVGLNWVTVPCALSIAPWLTQQHFSSTSVPNPKWTKEGLLEHILSFVVEDDQAFLDDDIPKCTKLLEEVIKKAKVAVNYLIGHFKTISSQILITFDAWTSNLLDKPLDWELKSCVLGFEEIKGNHGGANIAVFDRFDIQNKAVNKFVLVADMSNHIPKLKNKKYADFYLTEHEWDLLQLMKEVLEHPHAVQSEFSSETQTTLWKTIPMLECLQDSWENLLKISQFAPIHAAIQKDLDKLCKWYLTIDEILQPDIKLAYCKKMWDEEYYDKRYNALCDMVLTYIISHANWLFSLYNHKTHFKYHSKEYPTLSRIAHNYLAI
uniref:Uncharacterized protein n=1 Tax=Psilocybe cubensis TaxID=181762 RepID=A0A8H7XSR6_PSICU